MADSTVVGCAPPSVHDAPVTDSYPAASTVIGSTNEPTGWRGGTGKLELLPRDAQGKIQWRAVNGSHIDAGPYVGLKIRQGQSSDCFTIGLRRCHETNREV
jgi:hypothetical protein